MAWEDVKHIFRPEAGTVHMGVMKIDEEVCTRCGQCVENCPLGAWEMEDHGTPHLKQRYECFSCFNCLVTCPVEAVSIVQNYNVDSGFYATDPHPLPVRMPYAPEDAEGKPDQWTAIEKAVFERRSVRNYQDKPVPEPLIRRVLEAGRFAPSGGNCQPWKFIAITDKNLLTVMNEAVYAIFSGTYKMYLNDEKVKRLAAMYEAAPNPGNYDPRIILGGLGSVNRRTLPIFLNAPAVIMVTCDERAIGGPQIAAGICGTNMNLVANAVGLGACWIGFSQALNMVPPILAKLGIQPPWKIETAMALGYPRFKQAGAVPREFRPITWFREGAADAQVEE